MGYLPTVQGCGTTTATGNTPPSSVSAGQSYTIPKLTPFVLTAAATDTDPTLTYSWEEYDLGAATNSQAGSPLDTDENGSARPIFRSYNPTTESFRTFPSLYYILTNDNTPPLTYTGKLPIRRETKAAGGYSCARDETCVTGERLPSIGRTMNFRVIVRDNNPNGGGIADASVQITVDGTSVPFRVTTQNTAVNWQIGTQQTVTWDVAGTNNAPVNAQNVKISLSTDGGSTFPVVLADSVPNTGTATITVPNNETAQARLKINGVWFILKSKDNSVLITQFGLANDVPAAADYDGDRRADLAVWRPSNGVWYILRSSDGGFRAAQFGATGDKPVLGDYDRDGKADLAVYRPSSGVWYLLQSSNNGFKAVQFGIAEDKPVPADYDGDAITDITVFRPSSSVWYVLQSSDNKVKIVQFGLNGDTPAPGDYDGDGKTDIAVFRPGSGIWYILRSSDNGFRSLPFGTNGDIPIPSANLP